MAHGRNGDPKLRTKYAYGRWRTSGPQGVDLDSIGEEYVRGEYEVPLLVIPDAAVLDCRHLQRHHASLCANCGAYFVNGGWVLPKILRRPRMPGATK